MKKLLLLLSILALPLCGFSQAILRNYYTTNADPSISQSGLAQSAAVVFYPEQFGAVGAAATNNDSASFLAAWNATQASTNAISSIDLRGRKYNVNSTIVSAPTGLRNRTVTIENGVLLSTNQNLRSGLWSNCTSYVTFKNLYFGGTAGANQLSKGLVLGPEFLHQNIYPERVQVRNCVVTNFNVGIYLEEQDNPVLEGCRIFGCRTNSINLVECDQWVIDSTYCGFAYSVSLGAFGEDFYTGMGRPEWLTNQICIQGYGGNGGTIRGGCAMNWVRQSLYWLGNGESPTDIHLSGQNDFEGCFAPVGAAIIQVTNNVNIQATMQNYVPAGSNELVWVQLDKCFPRFSEFHDPPTLVGSQPTFSIFCPDENIRKIPLICGGGNTLSVNVHATYGDAGTVTVLPGGNCVVTTDNQSWKTYQFFDAPQYFRDGVGDELNLVFGADAGTVGAPGGSGNATHGTSFARSDGSFDDFWSWQDYSPGTFNKLQFGRGISSQRHGFTDLIFYSATAYGNVGTERFRITGSNAVFNALMVGNGAGLTNLSAAAKGTNTLSQVLGAGNQVVGQSILIRSADSVSQSFGLIPGATPQTGQFWVNEPATFYTPSTNVGILVATNAANQFAGSGAFDLTTSSNLVRISPWIQITNLPGNYQAISIANKSNNSTASPLFIYNVGDKAGGDARSNITAAIIKERYDLLIAGNGYWNLASNCVQLVDTNFNMSLVEFGQEGISLRGYKTGSIPTSVSGTDNAGFIFQARVIGPRSVGNPPTSPYWNQFHSPMYIEATTQDVNTWLHTGQAPGLYMRNEDSANGMEPFILMEESDSTSTFGPDIHFKKSNGTLLNPTVTSATQFYGVLEFFGYTGSAYVEGARYRTMPDGTPSASGMPSKHVWSVCATNSSTLVDGMTLDSTKALTVSNNIVGVMGVSSLRSNLLAPFTITVGASPFSWTNTLSPTTLVELYVDSSLGATVVSKNGGQIFGSFAGAQTVGFQANEYITLTYLATAPTLKCSPR